MDPVGITNAWTSVVVPNSRRMIVTVHSAINPRGGSELLDLDSDLPGAEASETTDSD
jgi:hypothetical protein